MPPELKTKVLVVANRTAATPRLLREIRRRAQRGPCAFALLIPDVTDADQADWTLDKAQPLLERAACGPVEAIIGGPEPFASVAAAVREGHFDEIIISTLPRRTSRWLRRDLIRKVERLGVPVTAVIPNHSFQEEITESDVFRAGMFAS
jgi:hypothetical protein